MAKLELQIGEVEFECEGDEGWVMKMYEKFLLDFLPKQGALAKAPVVKTGKRGRPLLAKKEAPAALPKKEKPAKKVKTKKAKKVKAPKVKKVKALPKAKKVIAPAAKPVMAPAPLVKAVAPKKDVKVKKAPKVKAKKVAAKPTVKAGKPATIKAPAPKHEVKLLEIKPPNMPPRPMPALSEFLKLNNANEMLMKKFLVTAVWLHFGGKSRMKPNDINEALMGIGEGKFNRPTDSLKNNIKKGFCARDGEKFFITELGFKQVKF